MTLRGKPRLATLAAVAAGVAAAARALANRAAAAAADVGCCVIKPSPMKTSWEYLENERFDNCYRLAKDGGAEFDHHPGKRCSDVEK
jgi:hypothetical protein